MIEKINERISVITVYDRTKNTVLPIKIRWHGRVYNNLKLAYYHKYKKGRTIIHVFNVTDGSLDFRLVLDSETLHWNLEEVSDGFAT